MKSEHLRLRILSAILLLAAAGVAVMSASQDVAFNSKHDDDTTPITEAVLREWLTKYSNWGRWPNDLGAANYITSRKRREAAKLVKEGVSIGLAHPLLDVPFDPQLPRDPAFPSIAPMPTVPLDPDNGNPFFHWMNPTAYTSDRYNVSYHGTAHSHMDALCHFQFNFGTAAAPDFRLFNGVSRPANNTPNGCARLGVENLINGVVTRGVLFDATLLPELLEDDHPWVKIGTAITRAHLRRLEQIQKVRVEPGDVILLYTGRWARRAALGPWGTADGVAGYYVDVVPFLFERGVSFIGHDMWNDVAPGGFPNFAALPVHTFAITILGVDIFDNLDLEKLAQTARRERRWEFMFSAAPSPVTGGTGSPLNPVAIF
jgi:kynurenine formamidase